MTERAIDGDVPTHDGGPRRRRSTLAGILVVALIALWGLAVASAALSARSSMRAAEGDLHAARDAVGELDIEGADAALDEARDELSTARRRLGRPDVRLAARLPVIGDDLRTARAVADGADLVAEGGRLVTSSILELPDGVDSLLPDGGALPAGALAELVGPVEEAAVRIREARQVVADSPDDRLVAQVADARADFLELVGPVADRIDDLAALTAALPPFLGADGPKRYFLAAANPAELRGTVGFLGSYAIATFDEGRLEIGPFRDLNDLEDVPPDELDETPLPPRYDPFGGSGTWKNLNMTPDFPTAATAIESLWAHTTGEELAGTIVVDPFALAALVELAGPVELDDGNTVAGDDVVDYVTNEAYGDFDEQDERKEVLGEVAGAALLGFLDSASEDTARASIGTLGDLVVDGHLLLHARDPEVQEALGAVGVDGAFPDPPGDLVAVVVNSASNAKVDYYTERRLDYDVELLADGRARGELEVTFANEAPADGRPRHVLGPNVDGLDVGDNRFFLSTYCASSCEVTAADGGVTSATVEQELGHPVANTWVEVPRDATETIGYRWDVPDAWEDTGGRLVYRLTIRHQVTVRPTQIHVEVRVPAGFEAAELPDDVELLDGAVTYETTATGGESRLEIRLRPTRGRMDGPTPPE